MTFAAKRIRLQTRLIVVTPSANTDATICAGTKVLGLSKNKYTRASRIKLVDAKEYVSGTELKSRLGVLIPKRRERRNAWNLFSLIFRNST